MGNTLVNKKILYAGIDIISLTTPQSRIIVFISGLLLLWLLPTKDLPYLPVRSLFVLIFHKGIYSTGITRGVSFILHGKFYEAYVMNKLSFLVLGVVFVILIKDIAYLSQNLRSWRVSLFLAKKKR